MSSGDRGGVGRGVFLYQLPPVVLCDFCGIMDGLTDMDWTRFASAVLCDQKALRWAERKERRTDWVMNYWGNRNARVGELIDLLERLQMLRPRDVILTWASSLMPPPPAPPPPPPPPDVFVSKFDPPPKPSTTSSTSTTCELNTQTGYTQTHTGDGGGRPLPGPAPPPQNMNSQPDIIHPPPQPPSVVAECSSGVMCWSYEEVHAGTEGFSPSLQVGEGGFGVVYRATLRSIDCAVKRLRQDCLMDWTLLRESFKTEVEKLTKFRHPHIVDLLGVSEGCGSVCLIYSYMDNRSLEDQLHNECGSLSWSQRVSVVKGASTALQFLHCPPEGPTPLIHGDVKSSNILLDCHLVAKLADFGLARFASHSSSGHSVVQTASVGRTATVRGTLAYLPDEYVRKGELGPAVDVYSFGVVLLEVLTGRRALETDRKSQTGERYLKDLVGDVEESPAGLSAAESWRKHLDHRLTTGGASEPAGSMEMVALACRCLDKKRKRRPSMTKVLETLQDIDTTVRRDVSHPLDSSVGALSQQLSTLGPLEDTHKPSKSSQFSSTSSSSSSFSSSSSSFCSLTSPHPLHSSSSLPPGLSSLVGPCETDESRGFSQYDVQSQFRPNGTDSRCLSPSTRNQYESPAGPVESQLNHPSVPTEDQYNFPPQPSSTSDRSGAWALTASPTGPESLSPVGSLRSSSRAASVHMNPSKQRFLQKKTLYEEGRIQTPELLSSDDLYGEGISVDCRGPEESDELDFLPGQIQS